MCWCFRGHEGHVREAEGQCAGPWFVAADSEGLAVRVEGVMGFKAAGFYQGSQRLMHKTLTLFWKIIG